MKLSAPRWRACGCLVVGYLFFLLVLLPCSRAAATPLHVLIIHPFGRDYAPNGEVANRFRAELARRFPQPIEFLDASLELARFDRGDRDAPLLEYLRAMFRERPPDLIVPITAQAMMFVQRNRAALFPACPILLLDADRRRTAEFRSEPGVTSIGIEIDLHATVADILHVLPETRRIYIATGTSPMERFWKQRMSDEWGQTFRDRVEFHWMDDLSLDQMRTKVHELPSHSAILVSIMLRDALGVPIIGESGLQAIREAANRPVFALNDQQLGLGIVGGRLIPQRKVADAAAEAAVRLLHGEPVSNIAWQHIPVDPPAYDWRELQRWKIPESRLPANSSILFRQPTLWETHRISILVIATITIFQAGFIALLLVQRSRRMRLEREARELRHELTHAGRVSMLGLLASSLAHELNQPLGAILRNAEAAELLLDQSPPDLSEVRAIVADIHKDDQRAGQVIHRLRMLLKRQEVDLRPLVIDELVQDVVALVHSDSVKRHVEIELELDRNLPEVRGDRVHLQQVLLNLMVNALEALSEGIGDRKVVAVRARTVQGPAVEISVTDNGPGIPADKLPHLFDPFFTTKSQGMGFGLSISRTIVEAHGGHLTAENHALRGAVFRLSLPVAKGIPA